LPKTQASLACPECGSNRLHFPVNDDEQVTCDDCRAVAGTLHDAKEIIAGSRGEWSISGRLREETGAEQRSRQAAEVETSQAGLRRSIAETDRLVIESDEMLRRHQQERDAGPREK
jgi:hypothetical protein